MSDHELLDVFDENNEPTGEALPRSEVHKRGLWHRSAHVFVVNSKNETLLQLRSKHKKDYPSEWDVSVAGHIEAGDSPIDTAIREVWEEIGLELGNADLEFIYTQKRNAITPKVNYTNNEFIYVYLTRQDLDPEQIKLDPMEVERVEYFSKERVLDMLETNKARRHDPEYFAIFEHLGI